MSATRTLPESEPAEMTLDAVSLRRFKVLLKLGLTISIGFHAVFLATLGLAGFAKPALFQVGSLAMWWAVWQGYRHGAYGLALVLAMIEVLAHALAISFMLGWSTGFHLYPLLFGVVAWSYPRRALAHTLLMFSLLSWVGIFALFTSESAPWTPIPEVIGHSIGALNHTLCFVGMGLLLKQMMGQANRNDLALMINQRRTEQLLYNVLPETLAKRLKEGESTIAEQYPEASVLFADIVGFTKISGELKAPALVSTLNAYFQALDQLAVDHGVEKIKTIGDAYMVAAGVPVATEDHAIRLISFARAMVAETAHHRWPSGAPLQIRVGLHTGPVVAGVIGTTKYAFDLWGDTVNVAARMESHGQVGRIQVTRAFADKLPETFELEPGGVIEVKGKGSTEVLWVR